MSVPLCIVRTNTPSDSSLILGTAESVLSHLRYNRVVDSLCESGFNKRLCFTDNSKKKRMNRKEDAGSTEEGKVVSHFKIRWT